MKTLNQSGQLTFDFMIAMTIALGLFIIFFAMTYTFTTVEVAQYVAFAAARAQAGSNVSPTAQGQAAQNKVNQLTKSDPVLKSVFNNGWFTFGANASIKGGFGDAASTPYGGSFTSLADASCPTSTCHYLSVFTGVSIPFISNILSFKVPFISNSSPADDGTGGFQTHVNAILIRESSVQECREFWSQRLQMMKTNGLSSANFGGIVPSSYLPMEDNGC